MWFQLNDHKVTIVDEATVMQEALGDSKGYKSACNLFYINKHIADHIKSVKVPIYSERFGQSINIHQDIQKKIKLDNYAYELEKQNFFFNQIVEKIHNKTMQRIIKIDN